MKDILKIGKVRLDSNIIAAPLHGVSCAAYRVLCQNHGAAFSTTQMQHPPSIERNKEIIEKNPKEKILAIQIVGKDPDEMADAAVILDGRYTPDMIDINLGCPDQQVLAKQAGSFLIKHPEQMAKMVSKVREKYQKTLTAKIRIGWDESSINCLEVCKVLEDIGVDGIAIHTRTRKQGYTGDAKKAWHYIKDAKDKANIPIIGNGDVVTPLDYKKMLNKTGCDFVMIGRAAMGNPHLFENCKRFLNNEQLIEKDIKIAYDYFNEFLGYYNKYTEKELIPEIRQHAMWLATGVLSAKKIKLAISNTKSVEEIKGIFEKEIRYRDSNVHSKNNFCYR